VPARRTEHLLIAQLLNPVAQLGSKCLYVLQSKARERGRRVLRERIRSDILRASARKRPPSRRGGEVPLRGVRKRCGSTLVHQEDAGFNAADAPGRRSSRPTITSGTPASLTRVLALSLNLAGVSLTITFAGLDRDRTREIRNDVRCAATRLAAGWTTERERERERGKKRCICILFRCVAISAIVNGIRA